MKTYIYSAAAIATFVFAASVAQAQAVWGSFDISRVNYPGGTLNGTEHSSLRTVVTGTGGIIAAGTPLLTAAYLGGVDVFYTSLLSIGTGTLSAPEQNDLQAWIASGGTLIVTADIFPIAAYDSFTSVYGLTYFALGNGGTGSVTAAHQIITGVVNYDYTTNAGFVHGANAMPLGDDGFGNEFILVMEPATGFMVGGRIAVFGDHNMFTNSFIGGSDNIQLATNLANWAAVPEPGTFIVISAGILCLAIRRRR
ncbi:MAG: PEP-CTERM sorting domain-containing protein [Armatimonadota bacterium]|nr:PEP-CTERM sorting domain-containing protein [Armatimonadota bacterium]